MNAPLQSSGGPPRLFDTHAHFDTFAAEGSVAAVLARAAAAGVEKMCAVGS